MAILLVIVVLLLGLIWILQEKKVFAWFESFDFKTWFLITAQSLLLSIGAGTFVWRWSTRYPQKYTDFISGHLAFSFQVKAPEYYGLYVAITGFVFLLVVLGILYQVIYKLAEPAKSSILRLSLYALIPTAILAGQTLRVEDTTYLLIISGLIILLSLITAFVLAILLFLEIIQLEDTWEVSVKIFFCVLFVLMSAVGCDVLSFRLGNPAFRVAIAAPVFLLVFIGLFFLTWRLRFLSFRRALDLVFTLSQFGIPLLFLVYSSPLVVFKDGTRATMQMKPALHLFLGVLFVVTYGDLLRRFITGWRNHIPLYRWFSPWVLFAILIFLQSYPWQWPTVGSDNYHLGEFYLPFWQLRKFNYLPFADYQPARGLINYLPGFFSWLFYDGSFSAQSMLSMHTDALYLLIGFFGLRMLVGNLGAFLSVASLFLFQGNIAGGLLVTIALLSGVCKIASSRSPLLALWCWLVVCFGATLFVVAEGALSIIGSLPLAFYLLYQAYRSQRKVLLISLGLLGGGVGILLLTTRMGEILLSITRYLLEQSTINDVAHGIPWMYPQIVNQRITYGYLWQIIRYSWLLMIIPIVLELVRFKNLYSNNPQVRLRWFWLVAIFVMCILIIPRANGRTDAVAFSRPFLVSVGIVMSALPYLVLPPDSNQFRRVSAFLAIAFVFGLMGNQENNFRKAWIGKGLALNEPATTESGPQLNLANIGQSVVISPEQVVRQTNIKKVLDTLLRSEETYFDATNNSADYGYQGYRCPVVDCAPYNTPAESQQARIIQQLEGQQIPLVLLSAEAMIFDGGPLSLRDYWLYRYLLERFVPFVDSSGYTWMLRKGQESRLIGTSYKIESDKMLTYLNSVLLQTQLTALPISWGASADTLMRKLSNPYNLLVNPPKESHGIRQLEGGAFEVFDEDAYLVWEVPDVSKGDILYIETENPIQSATLEVAWSNNLLPTFTDSNRFVFNAGASRYLVPLSSAPSWVLSQSNRQIRILFPSGMQDEVFFKNIILFDRVAGK